MALKAGVLARGMHWACIACCAILGACNSSDSAESTATPSATASSSASTTTTSTASSSTASSSTTAKTGSNTSNATAATSSSSAAGSSTAASSSATTASSTNAAAANAGGVSSPLTNYDNGEACLALTMPTTNTLFSSKKKVFAHYFYPFPVSIDNRQATADYYNTQYLNRKGESEKWLAQGGFLRQRPMATTPNAAAAWQIQNMQSEIRTAMARGITGFTFDSMSVEDATNSNSALHNMLAAAAAVDSRFKIVLMPDITALGTDAAAVIQLVEAVASEPAAYHLSDGRLVISAFDAGLNSAGWWTSVLNQLSAHGINVAFVPTFLGWTAQAQAFAPIAYGFADWGSATAQIATSMQGDPETAHNTYSKIFMMPVDPQQYRPKDFLYWEAGSSAAFRAAWNSAIQGDADWIQLVTWNDFSETSQVSPYTDATLRGDIGSGFYNLNGYYAAWFLTGQQPTITHDVLYYFYRREAQSAAAPAQSKLAALATGSAQNDIELLAFLTAPAELKISINGHVYTQQAQSAGIVSFKIPSEPGTPLFTLTRNGTDIFSFNGGIQIYGAGGLPSGVEDLTYWSGSASQSGICSLSQ